MSHLGLHAPSLQIGFQEVTWTVAYSSCLSYSPGKMEQYGHPLSYVSTTVQWDASITSEASQPSPSLTAQLRCFLSVAFIGKRRVFFGGPGDVAVQKGLSAPLCSVRKCCPPLVARRTRVVNSSASERVTVPMAAMLVTNAPAELQHLLLSHVGTIPNRTQTPRDDAEAKANSALTSYHQLAHSVFRNPLCISRLKFGVDTKLYTTRAATAQIRNVRVRIGN